MSKSMLVIDTPKCCEECPLELDVAGKVGANICRGCEKYSFNPDSKKKPDWCPLKEVPEKKLYNGVDGITGATLEGRIDKAVHEATALGWNACIDEILKERE